VRKAGPSGVSHHRGMWRSEAGASEQRQQGGISRSPAMHGRGSAAIALFLPAVCAFGSQPFHIRRCLYHNESGAAEARSVAADWARPGDLIELEQKRPRRRRWTQSGTAGIVRPRLCSLLSYFTSTDECKLDLSPCCRRRPPGARLPLRATRTEPMCRHMDSSIDHG